MVFLLSVVNSPIIFSFFSGAGFLDLGFEKSGYDIRFVNEAFQPFVEAYQFSRQKMALSQPEYGYFVQSIEDFLEGKGKKQIQFYLERALSESLVGFIGGPPCPDFSIAGKQKGHKGENGRLTGSYVELIIQNQPDFFIFENVKGLWRTKKHREFYEEIKSNLRAAGYALTDKLINSIEFGVPQDRERIILLGLKASSFNNISERALQAAFNWEQECIFRADLVHNKKRWPQRDTYLERSSLPLPSDFDALYPLTVEYWFDKNNVTLHPNAVHHFKPKQALPKFQSIDEGDDSKKSCKRLHRYRFSPTAAYGNNEVHLHPYQSRRLSAAEALAIQSLPAEFELPPNMSLSNMFKTIGNGVPFLAALGLAKSIKQLMAKLQY